MTGAGVYQSLQDLAWAGQQAAARLRLLGKALEEDDYPVLATKVSQWADELDRVVEAVQVLT